MPKEYFSHDYNTRNKKKLAAMISQYKMKGYGLFWIIVEMLYEDNNKWMELNENTYMAIAKESGCTVEYIKNFLKNSIENFEIFLKKEKKLENSEKKLEIFSSERVLENIERRNELSLKRSKAGQASFLARTKNVKYENEISTSVEQVILPVQQSKVNKSKVNKSNSTNVLVFSDEKTSDLKNEYEKIREEKSNDLTNFYSEIKKFVQEKKPTFPEPYVDTWNIVAEKNNLPKITKISDERRKKLQIRIREPEFDIFKVLQSVRQHPFYLGDNERNWKITFDYVIENQGNYLKLIESYKPVENNIIKFNPREQQGAEILKNSK